MFKLMNKKKLTILRSKSMLVQSSRKRRIRRIFTPTFGFVRVHLSAGDSNLRQFFFCWRVSNSLKTPEDDSWSPNLASATKDQKIAANPMPQDLSVNVQSSEIAVGVISFSSPPIRTSHSDCVLIDRTIITPMQI